MTFKRLKAYVDLHGLRETARRLGISHQRLSGLLNNGKQAGEFAEILCKLRVLIDEEWSIYGKDLDKEYLKK